MVCPEVVAAPSEVARAHHDGVPVTGGTIIAAPNPRRAVSHVALADTLMSGDAGEAPASEPVGAFFGEGSRALAKAQLGSLTVLGESVDEDKLPLSTTNACRTTVTDDESGYGTGDDEYARAPIDGSAILMDIGAFSDDGEEFDDDDDDDEEDDERGDLVVLELQRRAHGGEPLFSMGSPPQRCAVDPLDELISPPQRCAGPAPAAEAPCAAADRTAPALATLLAYSAAPIAAASPVGCGGGRGARAGSGLACSLLAVSAAAMGAPTHHALAHAAAMGELPHPAAAYGGYGGVASPPTVADPVLLAHHNRGRYRFGARPRLAASA